MSNLSDIKRRITSVKQTRQITGAMETVSIAKMRKAIERVQSHKEYKNTIEEAMRAVAVHASDENRDSFVLCDSGAAVVVVVSSDKGLCGGFDNDIFKAADSVIKCDTVLAAVGKKASERYLRDRDSSRVLGEYEIWQTAELAKKILKLHSEISSVTVVYSEPEGVCGKPAIKRILPVPAIDCAAQDKVVDCKIAEFEPSVAAVSDMLLPLYVAAELRYAALACYAAEQCARRSAMSSATDSADELIAKLSLLYNRERQTAVTAQITEIVGATAALSQRRIEQ